MMNFPEDIEEIKDVDCYLVSHVQPVAEAIKPEVIVEICLIVAQALNQTGLWEKVLALPPVFGGIVPKIEVVIQKH